MIKEIQMYIWKMIVFIPLEFYWLISVIFDEKQCS